MPEVKWQARRVSDGVLVDVTGDTIGTPASAPTANELEAGSGTQTISLLGPFTVNFNSSGITGQGALLTSAVGAGSLVFYAWAEVTTEWQFAGADSLTIQVAPNADPGNTYNLVTYVTAPGNLIAVQGDAVMIQEATSGNGSAAPNRSVVRCTAASRLVAYTGTAASAGQAKVYALIATPA